jgi:hypothetical protein
MYTTQKGNKGTISVAVSEKLELLHMQVNNIRGIPSVSFCAYIRNIPGNPRSVRNSARISVPIHKALFNGIPPIFQGCDT